MRSSNLSQSFYLQMGKMILRKKAHPRCSQCRKAYLQKEVYAFHIVWYCPNCHAEWEEKREK